MMVRMRLRKASLASSRFSPSVILTRVGHRFAASSVKVLGERGSKSGTGMTLAVAASTCLGFLAIKPMGKFGFPRLLVLGLMDELERLEYLDALVLA